MATKSILKNIDIRDRKSCKRFLSAINASTFIKDKSVEISKSYRTLSKDEIVKMFGDKKQ